MKAAKVHLLIALVLSLAFASLPALNTANVSGTPLASHGLNTGPLPSAPIASGASYDEQVGITLTQDFSMLAFNVSASAFTDNGIGPGYLVNGLTDQGYWYQVGLSYNWPMANGGVNSGFSMNYEVFSPSLNSIYPYNGGGGIQAFDGTVNPGDSVLLSLSFSQKSAVMQARDWQTGSIALQSFTAYASNRVFIGLPSSLDQSGFFSGLMTEQYHYYPYTEAGQPVKYTLTGSSISSAWMWMDEWNTNTGQTVFRANTSSPVSLDASIGSYFSSNGTAEIATAHSLVTGLTPVILPSLVTDSRAAGQPGHQAVISLAIEDNNGATVLLENVTITTSFEKYNFTSGTQFIIGSGVGRYSLTIPVPSNLALGTYNLTIHVTSWKYLDTQAEEWISLSPEAVNETLLVTNNPPAPPNSPAPNTSSSGKAPPTSTNPTTTSLASLLTISRSIIIPAIGSYIALGLLAAVLLIRQSRRRSIGSPISFSTYCPSCGLSVGYEFSICPRCWADLGRTTTSA